MDAEGQDCRCCSRKVRLEGGELAGECIGPGRAARTSLVLLTVWGIAVGIGGKVRWPRVRLQRRVMGADCAQGAQAGGEKD